MHQHREHPRTPEARRVARHIHHSDDLFVAILGTLVVLWALGGKLLVG